MIIFNIWAIPVAIVCYLAGWGIEHIFPALLQEPYGMYTIGALMIIVGGISDRLGAKARLFFLPVWLIGIGIICIKIGPAGWAGLGIIAVAGIMYIFRWAKKKAAEAWEAAQREFIQTPTPPTAKERDFWQWTKTVLYVDQLGKFTPEVCEHDLKVLHAIKKAGPQLSQPEIAALALLEKFLADAKNLPKPASIEVKLGEALGKMLDVRLKAAKEDAPFRSSLAARPLATA